uniref:ubiquitinyl hydrolase 1 n=1 Tax=Phallusia mammillata TaxID=59560 RepID=A0A6F9DXG9_9ASCI|nr:ubiquitin carboxyl-terminal hydrolase 48-like [Phallusia mammillata]
MDVSEENVQALLGMGFYDESNVRRALQCAKNDLNEAVSYLTCEMPMSSYDNVSEVDVIMSDLQTSDLYSGASPPSYDDVVKNENQNNESMDNMNSDSKDSDGRLDFPFHNLVELEGRVFTEDWSIPFRTDESLAKCLIAATKQIREGLLNQDDNCTRFLDRCMPECFTKLLTSNAVQKWLTDVQEGIHEMLLLFIDLVVARMQFDPLPISMLQILSTAFDPDCAWNIKNKYKSWNQAAWETKLGGIDKCFARPPCSDTKKTIRFTDHRGWMVNLINTFCFKGGLIEVQAALERNTMLDASQLAALLQPFSACADWLNRSCVQSYIAPMLERAVKYIRELSEDDFKLKKLGSLSDLLTSMKGVCRVMWAKDVTSVDDLRLEVTLRMVKCPHFNAKMNALKEVTKLIDETNQFTVTDTTIDRDKILDWLVDTKLLSISLDGHIDQSQYCDKIRKVVEFIGDKLSSDELALLWKLQDNASLSVSENVQSIISGASPQLNEQQLDLLFSLIHKSWLTQGEKARQQLVSFIGRIGHNTKSGRDMEKVLTLLWDLAHLPKLSPHLVDLALRAHNAILSESSYVKDSLKKSFIVRCIEDIKKDQWVVPALKQMHDISKTIVKSQFRSTKPDRSFLHDLNRQHDIVKLVVSSLTRCHQMAVESSKQQELELCGNLVIDERYKHSDYMWWHLNFLKFLLKEGELYLSWSRARDVWDTLVTKKRTCVEDQEACCEWFSRILGDMETDTVKTMFRDRMMKLDVPQLTMSLFDCFSAFMLTTNAQEQKIKRSHGTISVEKLDLIGIDMLWRICLECQSSEVAERAIVALVKYSYLDVAQKLKKDVSVLHSKFLNECYKRLNACYSGEEAPSIAEGVTMTTKILAANILPEVAISTPTRSRANKSLTIERLLNIVYQYITDIEWLHTEPRSLLPHGESFRGIPITLEVRCDAANRPDFRLATHGNETVRSIRRKIAASIEMLAEYVQLLVNDRVIPFSNDRLLLQDCNFAEYQVVVAKTSSTVSAMQIEEESSMKNQALLELEQKLPSVILANLGNKVFDVLFQLTDLDQPQITNSVRKLLLLLPTDPRLKRSIDVTDICDTDSALGDINESDSASTVSSGSEQMEGSMSIDGKSSSRKQRSSDLLFRANTHDMNIFRLQYNLEVLSGLLMPVEQQNQPMDIEDSGSFARAFIQNGGISVILNVLQKEIITESLDQMSDVDTKRGCYVVTLSIARYLLCVASCSDGEYTTHDGSHGNKRIGLTSEAAVSPLKRESLRVGSSDASATPNKRNRRSISRSPVVMAGEMPHAVKTTVQVLHSEEVSSLIVTLVRITWFASACKLDQLVVNPDSNADGTSFLRAQRWSQDSVSSSAAVSPFRHTSTSSVSSGGSMESSDHRPYVFRGDESACKSADSLIARQALELLVACLELRPSHLECFFEVAHINSFIIDILVQPSDSDVRDCAVHQVYNLSNISSAMNKSPRQRLLQILMKARVPFWHQTTLLRPKTQALVRNCIQYFTLRGKLIEDAIAEKQQKVCGVDELQNLEDEICWLTDFEIPTSTEYAESSSARHLDNTLLTGHLRLIKILTASPKVNKKDIGSQLIPRLLSEFLFPASKLILDASAAQKRSNLSIASFQPKCSSTESRQAAFDLLIEVCRKCTENLNLLATQLISMHHYPDQSKAKEFDFSPLVVERPEHGLVGLKNGGATCYMNSVLQQLFMVSNIKQLILSKGVEEEPEPDKTILYQLQKVFAHLHHSRLQFHEPSTFWKTFRLWGQEVNIREQQDAFEFFTDLTDQVDEYLKAKQQSGIFRDTFQGLFTDQKICEGCPHKYEREEPYFALNLTVKAGSLEDSLKQFVAGEKLEGDNSYFCEKCNEKRAAVKRTCIKSLPPVLVIQLKRFSYDWEAGRSLKFDHYFQFPLEVDMQPYLAETIAGSDGQRSRHVTNEQQLYRLVGAVIHSGQAQAGHYYSIIKDRRGTPMSNPHHGRWFKFNDTTIEEFEMTDQSLEEECFGGTFRSRVYEKDIPYDEERLRYWNAYLLFYEKIDSLPKPGKGRVSFMKQDKIINSGFSSPEVSPPHSPRNTNDIRLSQLTSLIRKGDQRGIFTPQITASIMQLVREENLQFMRNSGMYSPVYFTFIRKLVEANLPFVASHPAIAVTSLRLATHFLFHTFFRTRSKLLHECEMWRRTIDELLASSQSACVWLASQLNNSSGFVNVVSFLLECPNNLVRTTFAKILTKTLKCLAAPNVTKEQKHVGLDPILSRIVSLLDREVAESIKHSHQYFAMLSEFTSTGTSACEALFRHKGFSRLVKFLLGENATLPLFTNNHKTDGSGDATTDAESPSTSSQVLSRRWSSAQSRDFLQLHTAIANIILHCDVTSLYNGGSKVKQRPEQPPVPRTITVANKMSLPSSVKMSVFGVVGKRYLQELLFAAREISTSIAVISDVIAHCCYENLSFSKHIIDMLMSEIATVTASDLQPLLSILLEVLSLRDSIHRLRFADALQRTEHGFLEVIKQHQRSDEPKAYQCVKILVQLAARSDPARQFLLEISGSWSGSVTWLRGKMSEHTWSVTSQSNRSNETPTNKYFQRTMSAQHTLDEATALLAGSKDGALTEDDDVSHL